MPYLEIRAIKARDRLREDFGDIEGLAEDIKQHGLLHPIIVDERDRLVAGHRRLKACKLLGMRKIEIKRLPDLTPAERREIELSENLQRKDLTRYEQSKATIELAAVGERLESISPKSGKKDPRGRKPKDGAPKQAVADRIGIPRQTIEIAEQHVTAVERHPFMGAPDWTQQRAIKVAKTLDALPAKDRKKIVRLVEANSPPARQAEKMVSAFERAAPKARSEVYEMAHSKDPRERSLAITHLAETAPEPDSRAVWLGLVMRDCAKQAKKYPGDPLNGKYMKLNDAMAELREQTIAAHKRKAKAI